MEDDIEQTPPPAHLQQKAREHFDQKLDRLHEENIRAMARLEKGQDNLAKGQDSLGDRMTALENKVPEKLEVRLDRLEQSEQRRQVWVGAAIVTAVGAFVMTVWSVLTTGHRP